jgi:hypothetical protein
VRLDHSFLQPCAVLSPRVLIAPPAVVVPIVRACVTAQTAQQQATTNIFHNRQPWSHDLHAMTPSSNNYGLSFSVRICSYLLPTKSNGYQLVECMAIARTKRVKPAATPAAHRRSTASGKHPRMRAGQRARLAQACQEQHAAGSWWGSHGLKKPCWRRRASRP